MTNVGTWAIWFIVFEVGISVLDSTQIANTDSETQFVPPHIQMKTEAASRSPVPPISDSFCNFKEMNAVNAEQLRRVEAIIAATHRRPIEATIKTIALRVIDTVVARLSERFEERINDIEARIGIMPKRRAIESSAPEASHSPKDE